MTQQKWIKLNCKFSSIIYYEYAIDVRTILYAVNTTKSKNVHDDKVSKKNHEIMNFCAHVSCNLYTDSTVSRSI